LRKKRAKKYDRENRQQKKGADFHDDEIEVGGAGIFSGGGVSSEDGH